MGVAALVAALATAGPALADTHTTTYAPPWDSATVNGNKPQDTSCPTGNVATPLFTCYTSATASTDGSETASVAMADPSGAYEAAESYSLGQSAAVTKAISLDRAVTKLTVSATIHINKMSASYTGPTGPNQPNSAAVVNLHVDCGSLGCTGSDQTGGGDADQYVMATPSSAMPAISNTDITLPVTIYPPSGTRSIPAGTTINIDVTSLAMLSSWNGTTQSASVDAVVSSLTIS